jgi:hypothetical protein
MSRLSAAEARERLNRRYPDGSPRPRRSAPTSQRRDVVPTETRRYCYQQCPFCGNGHTGPPAGAGGTNCTRCGSDLLTNRVNDLPVAPIHNGYALEG